MILKPEIHYKWVILIAGVFYVAIFARPYVGCFNDDAQYILAATSLLRGHYVHLEMPDQPPINDPMPGYPLFLAPFVKIFAPHWSWLKTTSMALTLLSSYLVWKLFEGWLPPWACFVQMVVFAFNPTMASYSRAVMSEPCFVFLTLFIFVSLRQLLDRESKRTAWILGLLLGWASIVRPQGVVLIPSIAMGLGYANRWASFRRALGVSLTIWIAVLTRNVYLTQNFTGYSRLWLPELLHLSGHYSDWMLQCRVIFETVILKNFLNLDLFDLQQIIWLRLTLSIMGGFLMMCGVFCFSMRSRIPPAMVLAMYVFCFLYALVHSLWIAVSPRYFLPLMPFVAAFLLEGLRLLSWKSVVRPVLWLCLGSFLIGWYLMYDGFLIYHAHARTSQRTNDSPVTTLRWIEKNTSPGSKFFTNKSHVVYLYTGRQVCSVGDMPNDKGTLYHSLHVEGVNWIMFLPETMLDEKVGRQWERVQRWVSSSPGVFECVYGNPYEGTTIFRVLPDSQHRNQARFSLSVEQFT